MPLLGGLGKWLGSHADHLYKRLLEIGQTVASALRLGRVAGVDVEPAAAAREIGQARVAAGREEQFAALRPGETVPVEWFGFSEIPWDKPISYKVAVYGRSRVKTKKYKPGQFAHFEFDVTFSRPLTSEEVLDEARTWLTGKDYSPIQGEVSVRLIGGSRRLGEAWRW